MASKIALAISIVVCALLTMYACRQKAEAERQFAIQEKLRWDAEEADEACIKSRQELQETIDSLRLEIEDFESRMNLTKFSGDVHTDFSDAQ